MAYKALYRKYRPDTFEGVVGQDHIIKTLKNALSQNKVAHAYIFSGPRGTGKTSTAKLLAKALNCTSEETKPCNECDNCKAINESMHPDIIEIDAASNNGIDEIRDLIEKVKYAPIQGKYKVYIIDEVHMMTAGAFNALLKTLEEPPEHVVFILATTDVHKVIPTVLSRCQRFDFSKINYDDIKSKIIEILNKENITFEDGVPSLVAELADGGMRDALSILDQVVSYANDNITMQHVYDIYGMMSNQDMVEYLTLLAEGKTKEVLDMIESYIGKGIDVKRLTYDLMICLKDAIVFKSTSDESILERLKAEDCKKLLNNYSTDTALKVSEILNEARSNYSLSTNYRLFFELASLKIISILNTTEPAPVVTIERKVVANTPEVVKQPEVKEEKKEEPIIQTQEPVKIVKEEPKEVKVEIGNKFDAPEESEIISYSIEEYINIVCQGNKKFKEELAEQWDKIKDYVNDDNCKYVAQLLTDTTIGAASKDYILIIFDYRIISQKAKQRNHIILIRKFIKEILGYDFEVYCIDKDTFIDIKTQFFKLKQANKMPPLHEIPHLDSSNRFDAIVSDESEELTDDTVELGKELFGNDLSVE